MHNLDDNELDRLSREAADQFDPGIPSPGWEGLQKRLDREMPILKDERDRKYWLLLLLLFLAGGTGYLFYAKSSNDDMPISQSSTLAPSGKEDSGASVGESSEKAGSATGKTEASAVPDRKNLSAQPADTREPSGATANQSNQEGSETEKQPGANGGRYELKPGNGSGQDTQGLLTAAGMKAKNKNGKAVTSETGPGLVVETSETEAYQRVGIDPRVNGNAAIASLQGPIPGFAQKPAKDASNSRTGSGKTEMKKKKEPGAFDTRPFEFGLLGGTDKSQVHGTKDGQSGYNIGFTAGFNISKRWQINTGLIYNKKYYTAKGEDYHSPKGYWTDTVTLDKVNGNCLMWDLPINVRYNIVAKKNFSVFASAGISSYFMKTEDYGYHYYYYSGQYGYRYKSFPTNTPYWFGVGNLSAGFEQNLGSFSIQAEPYLKFALRGVGMGKVDLNSYGMNIGVKYKPNWSLKKRSH